MNIALVSPNKNSYSETFIQEQKHGLKGNVFYYFDGFLPSKLEGEGTILINYGSLRKRLGLLIHDVGTHSLIQSFKKHHIDVVLAHYGPTGEAVAPICEHLNIPLIVHFHGYDASVQTVIEKHGFYKRAFEVATYVMAVSKTMVEDLVHLGCNRDKIVYNPCAPNAAFFEVEPKFSKPQFLAVGRFTDKKAPYYTILAFNEVLKKYPHTQLVFGGEGELLNMCKNLVRYLNIEKAVTFKGIINRAEFITLLEDSLAFVQHSITADNGDKEGTPVAILEASLAGLPVISTYHAGIPDVIVHEQTGLLVEEHDVSHMSNQMITLLDDLSYAKRLGENGKVNIAKGFNMKLHIETLQEIIYKCINV